MKQYQKILLTSVGLFFGAILVSFICNFIFRLSLHFLGEFTTISLLIILMIAMFIYLSKLFCDDKISNPKCPNCEEQEVEHEGEFCEDCDKPKKGDPVM